MNTCATAGGSAPILKYAPTEGNCFCKGLSVKNLFFTFTESHHSNSVSPPLSTKVVDRFVPLYVRDRLNVESFQCFTPFIGMQARYINVRFNQQRSNSQIKKPTKRFLNLWCRLRTCEARLLASLGRSDFQGHFV